VVASSGHGRIEAAWRQTGAWSKAGRRAVKACRPAARLSS
jgi:hypothetical protein